MHDGTRTWMARGIGKLSILNISEESYHGLCINAGKVKDMQDKFSFVKGLSGLSSSFKTSVETTGSTDTRNAHSN